ncbi:MAG: response regulator [Chloroflexi bacterium]|nr:MAG: response regulator [Chloroflexota bacterium]
MGGEHRRRGIQLIQAALRSTAHEVQFAEDGAACVALIEKVRPDVVFSDVSMPEMDGFEVADALHARPDIAHTPIVFMTASVQRDEVEECFRHGAAGHLGKPFSMTEFRARIAQFAKS